MKNTIKVLAAVAALSCGTVAVRALSTDEMVDKVLGYLGNQGADVLCRKGDASAVPPVFSLRSFNGDLCGNVAYIAALAEAICGPQNIGDYQGSQCQTKGAKHLKGKDPTDILKAAVKKGVGKAKNFVCGHSGVPDEIKSAC